MSGVVFRISAGVLVGALIVLAASLFVSGRILEEQQRLAVAGTVENEPDRMRLAARLDPFNPEPLEQKSSLLQRQGRNREAENALREAIRRNPPDQSPRISLAYLQTSRLNDYAAAEETYRELLEYDPNSVIATNGLAQALLRQEKLEGAKHQFEILREMERISPRGMFDLGRVYIRTGEPGKGARVLQEAKERAASGADGLPASDRKELIESIDLAIADAMVVQGQYSEARQIVANSTSDQAPAILALLDTDPEMYRQSVLDSEIY